MIAISLLLPFVILLAFLQQFTSAGVVLVLSLCSEARCLVVNRYPYIFTGSIRSRNKN